MNQNNAQFKKFYDQITEEEEKARETIENALNEKKRNEEERKLKNKQELENYENELKKELEDKKLIVDQEQENLQKMEEESKKELEEIKLTLETKKGDIIDYIINNIMKVNMEFPEMVKKRFVKKKKAKK